MPELVDRITDALHPYEHGDWATEGRIEKQQVELLIEAREEIRAWKEAFTATRAYYSNNNGPNATRYQAAIKQLKEMKLIK